MNIFEITGDSRESKIMISDPAKPETVLVCKAKPGIWSCEASVEEKAEGSQIVKIVAEYSEEESKKAGVFVDYNTDYHKAMNMLLGNPKIEISEEAHNVDVNSCVIGIFDFRKFGDPRSVSSCDRLADTVVCEEDLFYSYCCDRALCEDRWGVLPNACVSTSREGKVVVKTFRKNSSTDNGIFKVEIDFVAEPIEEKIEDDSARMLAEMDAAEADAS